MIRRRLHRALFGTVLFSLAPVLAASDPAVCAHPAARVAQAQKLPAIGALHALVLFGTFADDRSSPSVPPAWADSLFLEDLPGSLTHFFDEMSHGQYRFTGAVAPSLYRSRSAAATYSASANNQVTGDFGRFVREIVDAADAGIDFGDFDNDGPDGVANSGDDDGFVDALFVVLPDIPSGFIASDANGLAALGQSTSLFTDDSRLGGGRIRIRSDVAAGAPPGGAIQEGVAFANAAGIIAHEHGHLLGLPDLFDTGSRQGAVQGPADDSAGIGYWGLMGHGARGWDDLGGPTPFSAWSLMQLRWLGVENHQLRILQGTEREVLLEDSNADGLVYQLPIEARQYLLVEHRRASGSYYDRRIPADGVLIWHINETVGSNEVEASKLVDLVCADGRYTDAGYPIGTEADPVGGSDNLDFWAHDATWRSARAGNLGDATDVFDGERFSSFTPVTNPASRNVAVEGIRRDGESMVADMIVGDRRKAGELTRNETWSGTIEVVADVTVPEGIALRIAAGTRVRFHDDGRSEGDDPERTELVVEGVLSVGGGQQTSLTSAADTPAAGDWSGIRVRRTGEIRLFDTVIEYTEDAVQVVDGLRDVLFEDVLIRHGSGDGLVLAADASSHVLSRVTVENVAGVGLSLQGSAPVVLDQVVVQHCALTGLIRSGGPIQCSDSRFLHNGSGNGAGTNVELGADVFGTISRSIFRGGTGIHLVGAGQVEIEDNLFRDLQVAVRHRSSRAWIVANTIADTDTAFQILASPHPERFELNRVSGSDMLIDNRSASAVLAVRNWWGTARIAQVEAGMAGEVIFEPILNFDPRSPVTFDMGPAFPNPMAGIVNIPFTVGIGDVSVGGQDNLTVVNIRNVLGGLVRQLISEAAAPGIYNVQWDGRDAAGRQVASGLYYAELDVGGIRLYAPLLRLR